MAAVTQADSRRIEQALQEGEVAEALAVLAGYPDLRHADLPAFPKHSLETVAARLEAIRALVLGLASPTTSVRRFARKFLPKLGPGAASPLLALALETIEPFRPAPDGSLGPVARHVVDARLSLEKAKASAVHSPAEEYGREVMDGLAYLTAVVDHDGLLRLHEYAEALSRALEAGTAPERPWPNARFVLADVVAGVAAQQLRRDEDALSEAVLGWARGELRLDGESDDPARRAIKERFHELGPEVGAEYRVYVRIARARFASVATAEKRLQLHAILREQQQGLDARVRAKLERAFDEFARRFPEEARAAEDAWKAR